jgi:hypothetical protein
MRIGDLRFFPWWGKRNASVQQIGEFANRQSKGVADLIACGGCIHLVAGVRATIRAGF